MQATQQRYHITAQYNVAQHTHLGTSLTNSWRYSAAVMAPAPASLPVEEMSATCKQGKRRSACHPLPHPLHPIFLPCLPSSSPVSASPLWYFGWLENRHGWTRPLGGSVSPGHTAYMTRGTGARCMPITGSCMGNVRHVLPRNYNASAALVALSVPYKQAWLDMA